MELLVIGPGVVEGSILLNAMAPVLVPTKAHSPVTIWKLYVMVAVLGVGNLSSVTVTIIV